MKTLKLFTVTAMALCMASCASIRKSPLTGAYDKSTKLTAKEDSLFQAVVLSHSDLQLKAVKVARQTVAGTNYRYECMDKNKKKVEVVVFQPLPGQGEAIITSVDGKEY